jgi:hypothetical protein
MAVEILADWLLAARTEFFGRSFQLPFQSFKIPLLTCSTRPGLFNAGSGVSAIFEARTVRD